MSHKRDPQFGYDPGWTYDYPRTVRMAPAERVLWDWWRSQNPAAFDELWYDCHIPRDADTHPPGYSKRDPDNPDWGNMWAHLTVLRADVIARLGTSFTVIELRSQARESSFAQVLRYTEMAKIHWPALNWLQPILICDYVPPEITRTGAYSAITLYKRPESTPALGGSKDTPATEIAAPV